MDRSQTLRVRDDGKRRRLHIAGLSHPVPLLRSAVPKIRRVDQLGHLGIAGCVAPVPLVGDRVPAVGCAVTRIRKLVAPIGGSVALSSVSVLFRHLNPRPSTPSG